MMAQLNDLKETMILGNYDRCDRELYIRERELVDKPEIVSPKKPLIVSFNDGRFISKGWQISNAQRDNKLTQKPNATFIDVMEFVGTYKPGSSAATRIVWYSTALDCKVWMMSRNLHVCMKNVRDGWLVGQFKFHKSSSYYGVTFIKP